MFWTNIPAEAFYGTDTMGRPDFPEAEGQYGNYREKPSISPPSPEYPTFMKGGIYDAERQIPGMSGEPEASSRGSQRAEMVEDNDELSEELIENTRVNALPQNRRDDHLHRSLREASPTLRIPSEIGMLPDSIQQMVQGVKPRFLASRDVPKIQVQPSTGSTLASSSVSARFPRPDSTFSELSIDSVSTRARPKAHLVRKPMDNTKLMPPKKSAMRRASQYAEVPATEVETTPPLPTSETTPGAGPPANREVARRSIVRFDLHRLSFASTVSSSSVETILADILPAKPAKSQAGRPEAASSSVKLSAPAIRTAEQEASRTQYQARSPDRQKETRSRSPSRLSYLCSDGSSPDSPFADPPANSPESPFADTQQFHSPSSPVEDERHFEAKRKKRMSHLVL